jgi:hypothetical protein
LPQSLAVPYLLIYNLTVQFEERLEGAKKLVDGIHEDVTQIIDLVQMALPLPQAVLKRILERAEQAKKIFTTENADEPNA